MSLEALLFDVDGTLADTERDGHRVAFNRAFTEAGLDWSWDVPLYGRLLAVTGGKERLRYYADHYRHEPIDDPLIRDLHRRKTRHYAELLEREGIPLRPGVLRLLMEARDAGIHLAIATTTTLENVEALLRTAIGPHARSWFSAIGAGDDVLAKKPAPDIYRHVLDRLGLGPACALAFEDSENGLRSARAAGLDVVITVNDYTCGQVFADAALVVTDLGEPDHPCRVLAGGVQVAGTVDLPVLRQLCRAAAA